MLPTVTANRRPSRRISPTLLLRSGMTTLGEILPMCRSSEPVLDCAPAARLVVRRETAQRDVTRVTLSHAARRTSQCKSRLPLTADARSDQSQRTWRGPNFR